MQKCKYKATELQAQGEGTMGVWKQRGRGNDVKMGAGGGKARLTEVIVTDWRPREGGGEEAEEEEREGVGENRQQRERGKERMLISTCYFGS